MFEDWLRERMREHNLSVAQLSLKLGIHRTAVYDWLKGKTLPNDDRVEAIADLFGEDVYSLLLILGKVDPRPGLSPDAEAIALEVDSIEDETARLALLEAFRAMIRAVKRDVA